MSEVAYNTHCLLLTVDASDFRSQASGNTFGIGRVTVGYTRESFFNTQLGANFIEFEIPGNDHVTLL